MIKPETHAEFIAAATACIKETRKEPGNIAYDLHESVTDHSKMVFVEQWENAEALVPHRTAEHMKAFGRVVVKCLASPPKIEVITPEKSTFADQEKHGRKLMIYVIATTP